jgi:hypothetical protein
MVKKTYWLFIILIGLNACSKDSETNPSSSNLNSVENTINGKWFLKSKSDSSYANNKLTDLTAVYTKFQGTPYVELLSTKSNNSALGGAKAKDALDAGAGGIIIPMIETAEQLESIIQYACWPPEGIRGVGFSRANLYGKYFKEYSEEALLISAEWLSNQKEKIDTLLFDITEHKTAKMAVTQYLTSEDYKKVSSQLIEKDRIELAEYTKQKLSKLAK